MTREEYWHEMLYSLADREIECGAIATHTYVTLNSVRNSVRDLWEISINENSKNKNVKTKTLTFDQRLKLLVIGHLCCQ